MNDQPSRMEARKAQGKFALNILKVHNTYCFLYLFSFHLLFFLEINSTVVESCHALWHWKIIHQLSKYSFEFEIWSRNKTIIQFSNTIKNLENCCLDSILHKFFK